MKKTYDAPLATVIVLGNEDVISTSDRKVGKGDSWNLDSGNGGSAGVTFPGQNA